MANVKGILRRIADAAAYGLDIGLSRFTRKSARYLDAFNTISRQNQMLLAKYYGEIREGRNGRLAFADAEFRAYSQNGEDGILLYIFSLIGTTNRKCVEICAGDGIECNTANLVINHGWEALMVDGDRHNIVVGKRFYRRSRDTFAWPPKLVQAWVTVETVNPLIEDNGFNGGIDLLSLDLDGVDYWIWKAIDVIQPRVVVAEINPLWNADDAVTVPYDPHFRARREMQETNYFGASLGAFVKLGREKGYRLVGCQRYGINAFFIRSDLGENVLPEVSPEACLTHPRTRFAVAVRQPSIANHPWVRV